MGILEKIEKSPDDIKIYINKFIPKSICFHCFRPFKGFYGKFCSDYCCFMFLIDYIKYRVIFFFSSLLMYTYFFCIVVCIISMYLLLLFIIVSVTHTIIF